MSVHITDKGEMVITMRSCSPGEDFIGLRTGIIDILSQRGEDNLLDFSEYCVLNFLRELELSPEQAEAALNYDKVTGH